MRGVGRTVTKEKEARSIKAFRLALLGRIGTCSSAAVWQMPDGSEQALDEVEFCEICRRFKSPLAVYGLSHQAKDRA